MAFLKLLLVEMMIYRASLPCSWSCRARSLPTREAWGGLSRWDLGEWEGMVIRMRGGQPGGLVDERTCGDFCLMPREHESDEDLSWSTDDVCDTSEVTAHARELQGEYKWGLGAANKGQNDESSTAQGRVDVGSEMSDRVKATFPRSGSPRSGSWDTGHPALHKEESFSERMKRFDCGEEENFVLHLPPSIGDEQDPTKEPDPTGALSAVEICDDRRFYGVSAAWQFRQDMMDGQQELLARRRLRRKAWESLVIPWNASDIQLRDSIPHLLRKLKEIDPTVDRDDVTQAIFKTIMCREQIKKVHEHGIKVGYNSSLRGTVFHAERSGLDLKTFSGPNRYEDLHRHVKERMDAEREVPPTACAATPEVPEANS